MALLLHTVFVFKLLGHADVNATCHPKGITPFHAAAMQGGDEAMKVILEFGKPDLREDKHAVVTHKLEVMSSLIRTGIKQYETTGGNHEVD
jgi:ankyrin repeat protein